MKHRSRLRASLTLGARLGLVALAALACDPDPVLPDAAVEDAGTDAGPPPLPERTQEELGEPGALTAGIAEVTIPAPLGIGTMGFSPLGQAPSPTPFSDMHPGTTRVRGQLTARAVALSRGAQFEVVFVRLDTIGVFQQLREAVLDELEERLGRRLDDALVLAGNHTHSGPGRLLMSAGALTTLGDTFFPEFYDALVDAIAGVVEQALSDLAPAEIGTATGRSPSGHKDRRCENDSLDQLQESPDLPVIGVRRGGVLEAVVASYAYHGTILGIDDLTLSGDVGQTIEQRIEERFDHPVSVLFFNSWGADMAPGDVQAPELPAAEQPAQYERMELLGEVVADELMPTIEGLTFAGDAAVRARTYRVPLSREAIGYDDQTFRYPSGGAFCGLGSDGNCEGSEPLPDLHRQCIRITASERLPKQTIISVGQVGELRFVTAGGEWSTALANGVLDAVRAASGSPEAMFIGYANDFTGYNLGEADWYQGGYEASGGLWGPGQGDYLAARTAEAYETFHDTWVQPPWLVPARVEPFTGYEGYARYVPEAPVGLGTIAEDVPAAATATDTLEFVVQGADPWLGAPVATLERRAEDGSFGDVTRRSGRPADSRGVDLFVDLSTDPPYEDGVRAEQRTFAWRFHFPLSRRAGSSYGDLAGGAYRFRVALPTGDGELVVHTGEFTVSTP